MGGAHFDENINLFENFLFILLVFEILHEFYFTILVLKFCIFIEKSNQLCMLAKTSGIDTQGMKLFIDLK